MKLSLALATWLKKIGVKNVFGVTGGSVVHLLHGAEEKGLKVVYTHHEQAASFAASAASRIGNNVSVCMVTTGPGGTNALTGLASAWLDSIPCLFISGQARSEDAKALSKVRQSGSQHLNITEVVKPLTKSVYKLIDSPSELLEVMNKAEYDLFNGRPGPVWIDIPLEFQWAEIDYEKYNQPDFEIYQKTELPDHVISALESSNRPVFVLGYGCRLANKSKLIIEFCRQNSIPYVLTWNTLDFAAYKNSENCGLIGISGTREANLLIYYSDLVIGFGTHLSKMLTGDSLKDFAPDAKNIFIFDIDEKESFRFISDERFKSIKLNLKNLELNSIKLTNNKFKEWKILYRELKLLRSKNIIEECEKNIPKDSINQYQAYDIISENLAEDDLIVVDGGGNVLFSALQSLKLKNENRLITGAGIGCMGSGIPESIGAAFSKNKRVICFIGDGSFQFNIQELQTIYHHNLNLIIILFNNDGYLAIKNTQDSFFERRFGVDSESGLSLPEFSNIIKGYNIKYKLFEHKNDLNYLNKNFRNLKGPCVLEIKISEKTPLIPRGGFKTDKYGNNVRRKTWDMLPSIDTLPKK